MGQQSVESVNQAVQLAREALKAGYRINVCAVVSARALTGKSMYDLSLLEQLDRRLICLGTDVIFMMGGIREEEGIVVEPKFSEIVQDFLQDRRLLTDSAHDKTRGRFLGFLGRILQPEDEFGHKGHVFAIIDSARRPRVKRIKEKKRDEVLTVDITYDGDNLIAGVTEIPNLVEYMTRDGRVATLTTVYEIPRRRRSR